MDGKAGILDMRPERLVERIIRSNVHAVVRTAQHWPLGTREKENGGGVRVDVDAIADCHDAHANAFFGNHESRDGAEHDGARIAVFHADEPRRYLAMVGAADQI